MSREALLAALPDLVAKGLITGEQAERIRAEYTGSGVPEDRKGQRMTAVLGTVGAALIGLGLVLLVAHNWDGLPRGVRARVAVLPVLAGQAIVAFGLWRRPGRTAWTEGGSVFLAAAVVGMLLFWASQQYLLIDHGYKTQVLLGKQEAEERLNRRLRLELDALRAPALVERRAMEELGMVYPAVDRAVVIERVNAATAPRAIVARAR